jgi:hypothetical protein
MILVTVNSEGENHTVAKGERSVLIQTMDLITDVRESKGFVALNDEVQGDHRLGLVRQFVGPDGWHSSLILADGMVKTLEQ